MRGCQVRRHLFVGVEPLPADRTQRYIGVDGLALALAHGSPLQVAAVSVETTLSPGLRPNGRTDSRAPRPPATKKLRSRYRAGTGRGIGSLVSITSPERHQTAGPMHPGDSLGSPC